MKDPRFRIYVSYVPLPERGRYPAYFVLQVGCNQSEIGLFKTEILGS